MERAILKKFVLLEIQNIKLKDVKQKINSNEDSNEINLTSLFEKLSLNWNKIYKKFGHLMLSLINNIDKAKDLSEELNKILEVISKFDKYYNTSSLKERISGIDSSLIDVSLEEIESFLNRKEREEFLVKRDKMSLQEILDLCKPLTPGKTFKSEEYDLIACKEQYLIVKPKTPKASIAWAMSDPNGNLERYGKGEIPEDAKPPWCTSIYSSDKESNNEFYHYFLNQQKSLYYVIKRNNYSFSDPYRKVSIGVDDDKNNLKFNDTISVNADNNFIKSEGEFIEHFRDYEASTEILKIIKQDKSRQEYLPTKKRRVEPEEKYINILFENRFKSFAARSKLQYFIQKTGDINFLINLLDVYTDSLKKNTIIRDERDVSDIIRTLFDIKAFLNNLTFSSKEKTSITKVLELKSSSIAIDLLDCIKIVLESNKSNLIDGSIFYIIFPIIHNSTVEYINKELKIIIDLIREKNLIENRLLKRLDDSLSKRVDFLAIMTHALKDHTNKDIFKMFIRRENYKYKFRGINILFLKNPLLFKTQEGKDIIDSIYFKKTNFSYFEDSYENIIYNKEFFNYDKLEELINLYAPDKYFTHAMLVEIRNFKISTIQNFMSEEKLTNYIQKVNDLYKGKKDEHSIEIIEYSNIIINQLRLYVV